MSWGVDFADTPTNPPWAIVLDEISASPVSALELGPVGYLPEDPAMCCATRCATRGLIGGRDVRVRRPARRRRGAPRCSAIAERACRAIAAAGGAVLVADRPARATERAATAGRSDAARRLSDGEWAAMRETVDAVAAIAREHGLRPAFHAHAGGFVEFADEVERLLDDTALDLCFDSGHAAYAGIDAGRHVRRWGERIAHVHLKDVRADVLARVEAERLGFWEAIEAGVFCPLGDRRGRCGGGAARARRRRLPGLRDDRAGPRAGDGDAAGGPAAQRRRAGAGGDGSRAMSVAIVTGGSSGIGRATALGLARAGHDVGITHHRDDAGAEAVVAEVAALGRRAAAVALDLTDPSTAEAAIDGLADALGGELTVLVNCAGVNPRAGTLDATLDQWTSTLNANLIGPWACARGRRAPHGRRRDGRADRERDVGAGVHAAARRRPLRRLEGGARPT